MSIRKHSKAVAFIDGASRGNPGPASIGVVFQSGGGEPFKKFSKKIGLTTNNIAEYYALIFALQEAVLMGITELEVYTDSELLAKQFSGEYKIKDSLLKLLFPLIMHLKQGFKRLTLVHVPRERNRLADQEANKALDQEFFL